MKRNIIKKSISYLFIGALIQSALAEESTTFYGDDGYTSGAISKTPTGSYNIIYGAQGDTAVGANETTARGVTLNIQDITVATEENTEVAVYTLANSATATGAVALNIKESKSTTIVNGDTYVLSDNAKAGTTAKATVSAGTVNGNLYIVSDNAEAGSSATATISGGTVNGNVYVANDYATVGSGALATISSGSVNGNVYVVSDNATVETTAKATISGGTVTGNVYVANGGTIGTYATATVSSGQIDGSLYILSGTAKSLGTSASTSTLSGGKIVGDLYAVTDSAQTSGNVTLKLTGTEIGKSIYIASGNSTITGNASLAVEGDDIKIGESIYLASGNSTITGNASLTLSSSDTQIGGTIYGAINTSTVKGDLNITLNGYNENYYEIVASDSTSTVMGSKSLILNKYIVEDGSQLNVGFEGFDYLKLQNSSGVVLNSSNINNTETAVQVLGSTLSVEEVVIDGNSVAIERTGHRDAFIKADAYSSETSSLTVSDSSFSNIIYSGVSEDASNSNGIWGSVINAASNSDITIYNTTFNNNAIYASDIIYNEEDNSQGQGGVIYITGGSLTISNSSFDGNLASGTLSSKGGAIYSSGADLSISDTTFSNNTSTAGISMDDGSAIGGAIVVDYSATATTSAILTNTVFTGNKVLVDVETETVSENIANGGAITQNGGSLTIAATKNITNSGNAVIVNDIYRDDLGGFLYLSSNIENEVYSSTSFNVSKGATLTIGDGREGYDSIASEDDTAVIYKTGTGTLTVNSSMQYYTGALNVEAGVMEVNNVLGASSITISSGATLSATINDNYTFSNDSLTVSNAGTLKLVAGVNTLAGTEYAISKTLLDFDSDGIGAIAYGGSVSGNTFTVGTITSIDSIDLSSTEVSAGSTIKITDSGTSSVVTISTSSSATTDVTVSSASDLGETLTSIDDKEVLSAWSFEITGVDETDGVVLSFLVSDVEDTTLLQLLHRDDESSDWEIITGGSYDADSDLYSVVVYDFCDYALVAVPEPSTYAMIFGALALGLAMYRRRK